MVHYNKIMNNLYLGDAGFVYMEGLPKFTLIINCCPEIGQLSYSNDIEEIIKLNLLYFDKNLFKRKFKNMNQFHLSPGFTAPFQKIVIEKILNQLNLIN